MRLPSRRPYSFTIDPCPSVTDKRSSRIRCKRQLHEGAAPVEVPDVVLGLLRLVVEVADDSALMVDVLVDAVRLALFKDLGDPADQGSLDSYLRSSGRPPSRWLLCCSSPPGNIAGQRLLQGLLGLLKALRSSILTTIVATNQPTAIPRSAPPTTSLGKCTPT